MPYAEVVYETGAHSLVSYDSIDELEAGLSEHHRRAINGEPGAPQEQYGRNDLDPKDFGGRIPPLEVMKSRPAERVKKVYLYDEHPTSGEVGNDGVATASAAAVTKLVEGMTSKDKTLNVHQLIPALRDEVSPVHTVDHGKFASHYKAEGSGELDLKFLKEVE